MSRYDEFINLYLISNLLYSLCVSQSAGFQYPIGHETFNILDTINVSWTSNYETAVLFTWVWDPTVNVGQEGTFP